jgi:hypothetical protein
VFFQGFNVIFNKPIWGVFSSLKHRFHRTKGDEVTSRLRQLDVPDIFRQEKQGKISFYSRQNLVFPPKIEIRGLGCADLRSLPQRNHQSCTCPRARRAPRRLRRDASRSARRACQAHTATTTRRAPVWHATFQCSQSSSFLHSLQFPVAKTCLYHLNQ